MPNSKMRAKGPDNLRCSEQVKLLTSTHFLPLKIFFAIEINE